jgi:hypothetical protein
MNKTINSKLWHNFNRCNKRQKINKIFVSGTQVANFLLQDPVLDWFEYCYNKTPIQNIPNNELIIKSRKRTHSEMNESRESMSLLFDKGIQFENEVSKVLHNKFGDDVITINTDSHYNAMTIENHNKTINAMLNGIPIIEQAVLFNYKNNTRGIADLLVRSDYINKIINRPVLDNSEETFKAPNLNGNYHYLVIDIKWACLSLCSNGKYIRNTDRYPAYKGQLAIYTNAIGLIQGYIPNKAFILAKNWKICKNRNFEYGNDCFELLGVIDYSSEYDKKYINKTIEAIEWVKEVKQNGHTWNLWDNQNLDKDELYPNMCNKNFSKWDKLKEKLADSIGELTMLWNVHTKHRNFAHKNGIKSWRQNNCTADKLGIKGKFKNKIINNIIKVNRSNKLKILPKYINNNIGNWQESSPVDFYIDFETLNINLYEKNMDISYGYSNKDIIFLIGIGYIQNCRWNYKSFICENLTIQEEYNNINKFIDFINNKSKELDCYGEYIPRLFHWTHAEKINIRTASKRHSTDIWNDWAKNINWIDMHKVFVDEPIVVKGAFNYTLKNIGNAFYNNKFIKTKWDDEICSGFVAMQKGVKYYRGDKTVMKDIIKYNKVDCKIIYDIVKYLRKKHVDVENML